MSCAGRRASISPPTTSRGRAALRIRGISQEEFDRPFEAKKEADAALIVARAAERVASLNVEFTRVPAPIGGRISRISSAWATWSRAARSGRRC